MRLPLPLLFASLLLSTTAIAIASDEYAAGDARRDRGGGTCPSSAEGTADGGGGGGCDSSSTSPSSVYVIGDIHGDAICAVSWVNRTGLVGNLLLDESSSSSSSSSSVPLYRRLNDPSRWTWTDVTSTLVFMGDYVDKGPTAKQTVEFVRHLTLHFPENVIAILGNHELELLRDRDGRVSPVDRYSAYSYATVHPGDYHNYIAGDDDDDDGDDDGRDGPSSSSTTTASSSGGGPRALDDKDDLVLDLLYEANMEVYAHRAHSAVRIVPSLPPHVAANHDRIRYAITDIMPPEHRALAGERLAEYQAAYLDAYRSGTRLGSWLEGRPIAHLAKMGGIANTLFVHGGVSDWIGRRHFANGTAGVDAINSIWWDNSHEGRLYDFLNGGTPSRKMANDDDGDGDDDDHHMGNVVYELLTYRGNHPGYKNWDSHGTYEDDPTDDDDVCNALYGMLERMDGIDRIAVGHTPEDEIRIMCDGKFLALDSTLGRWIRGTGNEYCPGPEHFDNRRGVDVPRTSRNGKYRCDEVKEICEGQIVRLDSDGSVNVLTM
jgi:hypothetical protein